MVQEARVVRRGVQAAESNRDAVARGVPGDCAAERTRLHVRRRVERPVSLGHLHRRGGLLRALRAPDLLRGDPGDRHQAVRARDAQGHVPGDGEGEALAHLVQDIRYLGSDGGVSTREGEAVPATTAFRTTCYS